MPASAAQCARQVLEAVPLVMRAIRREMRRQRKPGLSVPQFRILVMLNRHQGASLSEVAEHMGLTLPSISKMVDGLVVRDLLTRETDPGDRRRLTLSLTPAGHSSMQTAYAATQTYLAGRLETLAASEREALIQAMAALVDIFGTPAAGKTACGKK